MIDFDKLVDNHIKREHKPKGIGKYYPSEIGGCLRKVWYTYKYPQEIDPKLLRIFEVGNMVHDFVVRVFKNENKEVTLLESELPVQIKMKDFLISGRIDDLILVKANNKKILIEVKSANDIRNLEDAKPHHKMQLQLYMLATKIYDGLLLYLDKKNLQSKIFVVPYDEAEAVRALERFHILHNCLIENKIPEPEAKLIDEIGWMCNYCEYKDRCDKD